MLRLRRVHAVVLLLVLVSAAVGIGLAPVRSSAAHHASAPEKSGIPPRVRSVLLATARRVAALESDPSPHDIEVVRTTHGRAERLGGERFEPPRPGVTVYLVAMRGHFVCRTCSYPHGARAPRGSVITLEILASTMRGIGFTLDARYPALRKVGIPLRLG